MTYRHNEERTRKIIDTSSHYELTDTTLYELIAINLAIIADELSELNELYEHEHPYYYKGGDRE